MKFGIVSVSVIPLRAEPSHKSQMVSQVLFGESFKVIDSKSTWVLIQAAFDNYEGWIEKKEYTKISEELFLDLQKEPQFISGLSSHTMCLKLGLEQMVNLLPGSTLPFLKETKFNIIDQEYLYLGDAAIPDSANFNAQFEEASQFYINAPYLWGGRSLYGIDCSGFSQIVYKHLGVHLPRDAWQQAKEGRVIDFIQETKPGDLAFFEEDNGNITHVGMILDDSEIIHASGRVKVDQIDEQGIFCLDTKQYTHKLRIVKRIND